MRFTEKAKQKSCINIYLTIFFLFILFLPVKPETHNFFQDTSKVVQKKIVAKADSLKPDSTQLMDEIIPADSSEQYIQEFFRDYSELDLQIEIENGEQYTKNRNVVLALNAPEARDMIIGNSAQLKDGLWEPYQRKVNWSLAEGDGYQMVYFRVRYPDSSLSRIVYDEIILDSTPPTAKFVIHPDTGIAGETLFLFDATASSHNFELFLRWDWDGDGTFDTDWTVSKEAAYKYLVGGGEKKVILEIKDSGGWVASVTQKIVVYSRPKAEFTYTQNFQQPLKITLDGSLSSDYEDENNLWYRWNVNSDSTRDVGWTRNKKTVIDFQPFHETNVTLEVKDSQSLTDAYELVIVNEYKDMIYVPAGKFFMGSENQEIDERPRHEVEIGEFWIDKYPVTNEQYSIFLNEYIYRNFDKKEDVSKFIALVPGETEIQFVQNQYVAVSGFENHPVVNVTWFGADVFARFYNKRLPTEAEWEKTARGTDERTYPWGSEISGEYANYWDSGDPYDNGTTPVAFFNGEVYDGFKTRDSFSFYGAYDMVGNVREWVGDWYQRDYYSVSPVSDPLGPKSGLRKVVRGGGFLFHADDLRAAYRYSIPPDKDANYVGFRCIIPKMK